VKNLLLRPELAVLAIVGATVLVPAMVLVLAAEAPVR
jgi:hypothetical protein